MLRWLLDWLGSTGSIDKAWDAENGTMKLVIGLGNPGRKYEGTRHNIGFDVVSEVGSQAGAGVAKAKFQGQIAEVNIGGTKTVLLMPHTYMNRSGGSVRAAFDFYKLELENVLVVCDDLSLPVGRIRFRAKGSAGGQKGLADILAKLGSPEVPRLRIGIGQTPENWDTADYVLGRFREDEKPVIREAIDRAAVGVVDWIRLGISDCMNRYNG